MALRLATRQHLPSLNALASMVNMTIGDILAGRSTAILAALAGFPKEKSSYVAISIDTATRTAMIGSEAVFINDFSLASRRWCSTCLREDIELARRTGEPTSTAAWSRPAWDLRSVIACHRHLVALLETCPSCSRVQDWNGPAIDRCACGGYLAQVDGRPVPVDEVAWETFVTARLAGKPGPPLLAPDPIRTLVPSIERVGFAANSEWTVSRMRASPSERAAARRTGMAVIANWPGAFHDALDRVCTGMGGDGRPRGLVGGYGWVHGEWAHLSPVTRIDTEVRSELRRHALHHEIVAEAEPMFGEALPHTISMTAAARVCGMSYPRARKILDAEGVIPGGVRRGVAFPLRPEAVAAAISSRPTPSLLIDASAMLGVGRSQTRRLRAQFGTGHGDWSGDLLTRLREGATRRPIGISNFRSLPAACRSTGVALEDACGFVLQKSLSTFLDDQGTTGIYTLMVDTSQLRALGRSHLSIERAAKLLGIHHDAMRWLIRSGKMSKTINGVCPTSLAKFDGQYIAAARLAARTSISLNKLAALLSHLGVRAAFGPPLCRQIIYERAEAERASGLRPAETGATLH